MENTKGGTNLNKKKVTTKIKCPQCGFEYEIEVEVPAEPAPPKMGYQG